jgi:hypothetical protein
VFRTIAQTTRSFLRLHALIQIGAMTTRQFAQILRRRWYVLALLLACTAAMIIALPRTPGLYWARVSVVFLPPVGPESVGNVLEGSDSSLVFFAAAVQRSVGRTADEMPVSSAAATLYGTGVQEGYSVTLVNSGGQWRSNFNRPMLTLEVVGGSAKDVANAMDQLITRVQDTAVVMQRNAGARERSLIRTELSPEAPEISYVSGDRNRALTAALLLGVGISLASTLAADRVLGRRRRV